MNWPSIIASMMSEGSQTSMSEYRGLGRSVLMSKERNTAVQESPFELIDFREKSSFWSSWCISAAWRVAALLFSQAGDAGPGSDLNRYASLAMSRMSHRLAFWKFPIRCKMIALILERY